MSSSEDNKSAISELFSVSNQHGRDIAVLHQENAELKAGQVRLQNTMADHGDILHAIKADVQSNRFPGLAPIAQMTVYLGTIIMMVVAGISYISANFASSHLSPRLVGLEQKNITIESRLDRVAPALKRLVEMEKRAILLEYRLAQIEKRPGMAQLMFRSQLQ